MDLHAGETEVFRGHPSWRSTLLFYATALVVAAVVGVVVALAASTGAGILAGAAVLAIGLLAGFLRRIGTVYVITDERLHIRRGILARRTQETRIDRVQNVNTQQGVFERVIQVGTVEFDTAGTDDSDFVFAGVASPDEVMRAVDRAQRKAKTAPGL